jgi:cytoskeletal protein CcmA (bactofilin family)
MFGSRQQGMVIGKGLKVVGSVTAEGLVWVYGQIDGELHCTSLVIDRDAHISGTVTAERVVVDGKVEGQIQGGKVVLKSGAQVVGDIHHQSLAIESGAFLDGRSVLVRGNGQMAENLERNPVRQVKTRESLSRRARAVPVEAE